MAYSYEYSGENLYLGIPEPEYDPDEGMEEDGEDRYLLFFSAAWGGGVDETGG